MRWLRKHLRRIQLALKPVRRPGWDRKGHR